MMALQTNQFQSQEIEKNKFKLNIFKILLSPFPIPHRDCVVIGEMVKNVMLNLFQHLIESISYETLKRVQGDKK